MASELKSEYATKVNLTKVDRRGSRLYPWTLAGAPELPEEAQQCKCGAAWPRQVLMALALGTLAYILLQIIGDAEVWILHRGEVLIALTGIAFWRWSWFMTQNIRALIYRF
ncbi:MAG TPA: hypothetical protein VGE41_05015, partial [Verrucomicrobiae bacterium]